MNKSLTFAITWGLLIISSVVNADWSIKPLSSDYRYAQNINDTGQALVSGVFSGINNFSISGANGEGSTYFSAPHVDNGIPERSFINLNNAGQVTLAVSYYDTILDDPKDPLYFAKTFLFDTDQGKVSDLTQYYSTIRDINDNGLILGTNDYDYILGDDKGNFSTLSLPSGSSLNNLGQVTGFNSSHHAIVTGPNGIGQTDLGTLGGNESAGLDINNSGQVVGSADYKWGHHAFITENGNTLKDLGTLGGYHSVATDINDLGEAIGWSEIDNNTGVRHYFLYSHGGITDPSALPIFNEMGWEEMSFNDINNFGQILGYGNLNGHSQAFILSYDSDTTFNPQDILIPVPEPSAYLMLLAGLGLLGFVGRRKTSA